MARKYSNTFAETTLTGSISNSATTIQIGSTTGLPPSFPYTLAIDYGTSSVEMVTVTNLAGSNLTVPRGQDGTSAQSHNAGVRVVHPVSARDLSEPQVHIDATSDVHGLSGGASVVGTSQTQTLTNKTISGSGNTLTNIPNSAIVAVDAAKVTQPFATMTVTGASGAAQVMTVTGDEVSRTKPIASWKRGSIGLFVDEDAVVDVNSDLSVGTVRASAAAALTSRLYILATTKIGALIQRVTANTQDLFQIVTEASANLFKVDKDGNITAAGSVTAGTSLNGVTAAVSTSATVGTTLGVSGLLTASAAISTTNVTASGTVQGATVTATGALNGATAAITGAATTGTAGVSVSGETWHALTLSGGWSNFGGGFANAQYKKLAVAGAVQVVATITGGTTTDGTTIGTLPSGYRPSTTVRSAAYGTGASLNIATQSPAVDVLSTGAIQIFGVGSATNVAFNIIIPTDV